MLSLLLRLLGTLVAWVLVFVIGFFVWASIKEYTPAEVEEIYLHNEEQRFTGDTITLLSWNIGYAGLGSDMDFFMDGGQSSRTSRGRTLQNLDSIMNFLERHANDVDFIFLQEVDFNSFRTYGINEYDSIIQRLGMEFKGFSALNFHTAYVPIPLGDAIGRVSSGLMTLSRTAPSAARRYSYPAYDSWPYNLFNLKRCMLSIEVPIGGDGHEVIYLNNTHNSAYDEDGSGRAGEIDFISEFLSDKRYSITAGDWNSTPEGYVSSQAELDDEYFKVQKLGADNFPSGYHFAADLQTHSMRYGYEPYRRGVTTTSVIDFAVSSPRVVPLYAKTIDLGFESSDHNPVIYKFVIQKGSSSAVTNSADSTSVASAPSDSTAVATGQSPSDKL